MRKTKKLLRNLIIFIVLIILTFYIILKDQNFIELFQIIKSVKKEFILIAIICMCIYLSCEAINMGRTLKVLNEKSTFGRNLKYALIGFFFSSITPAASGGQPMQIYYMHKDNISIANSTLALLINLACVQFVTISIAFVSFLFHYKNLTSGYIYFFAIGITLNLIALFLLFVGIFSQKIAKWFIKIAVAVLKFFHFKNIEEKQIKMEEELEKYQASAEYIRKNKFVMLKILLTTYFQYIVFYSIAYFVYCSFGNVEHNLLEITTMQSVVYATVSGIPSPGAVGVSEGAFIAIFKKIYTESKINGAMLLNRGVNFYLFVVISAMVVMINTLKEKKQLKKEYLK